MSGVAPRVGAWIETYAGKGTGDGQSSLPVWERGLKLPLVAMLQNMPSVAPRVGAWIETL